MKTLHGGRKALFICYLALYHCAIIHSLSSSNKLSTGVGVFGLSRLLAHFFLFLRRIKVCAFIFKKNRTSNAKHDNVFQTKSRKFPTWGQGYSAPKSVSELIISKYSLFRAAFLPKRVDLGVHWWQWKQRRYIVMLVHSGLERSRDSNSST